MVVHGPDAAVVNVAIRSGGFRPHLTEIARGQTVTWTNEDDRSHTVSSAEMESGELLPGQTWSHTFDRPGHFRYFCMLHPRNVGEVLAR